MHIAINGAFWNQPHTGSGQYTRQLVYHLNRLVSDLALTLVFPQTPGADGPADVPPSVRVHKVPARSGHLGKVLFEQRGFPRACRAVGATLAHVPYWGGPLASPVPVVVTVHDIITALRPEYRRGVLPKLYQALVTAGARGAGHVITDSQVSKADIVRHLAVPPERVSAIYLGLDPRYTETSNFLLDMAVLRKYDLPDFYVLYLGGYALHKNIVRLLTAYTYVAQALGDEYPLILAGKKPEKVSPAHPDYDAWIDRFDLADTVRWIGFVDEDDKPALYRQASAFVFPSEYEGFGLPPLEAMACGAPVVASTGGSLNEILGDAALAVDPGDERGLAGAIIATLVQDDLAAELKAKGPRHAAAYTWDDTVAETVRVYARVAGLDD
jgi:glycosyltransferase involved in cell wall biosynthesis